MESVGLDQGYHAAMAKASFSQFLRRSYLENFVVYNSLLVNAIDFGYRHFTKEHFNGKEILHLLVLYLLRTAVLIWRRQGKDSVFSQLVCSSHVIVRNQKLTKVKKRTDFLQ